MGLVKWKERLKRKKMKYEDVDINALYPHKEILGIIKDNPTDAEKDAFMTDLKNLTHKDIRVKENWQICTGCGDFFDFSDDGEKRCENCRKVGGEYWEVNI